MEEGIANISKILCKKKIKYKIKLEHSIFERILIILSEYIKDIIYIKDKPSDIRLYIEKKNPETTVSRHEKVLIDLMNSNKNSYINTKMKGIILSHFKTINNIIKNKDLPDIYI